MGEEIKEILDKLLEYFKESNINDFGYEKDKLISYEEAQILLDYITNLQEEVNKLTAESTEWESKFYDLQEENEILYKELEKADSITQSCIFEGSRSAGKSYRQCLNWLEDYKSRCEKAIEYIKTTSFFNKSHYDFKNDLLNILNGGENND